MNCQGQYIYHVVDMPMSSGQLALSREEFGSSREHDIFVDIEFSCTN